MTFPCVCALTLRTSDGQEQTSAAIIPNKDIYQHYLDKAHTAGLEIEIKNIDNN